MTSAFFYVVVPAKFVCVIPEESGTDSVRSSARRRDVLLQIKEAFDGLAKSTNHGLLLNPAKKSLGLQNESSDLPETPSGELSRAASNLLSVKPPELVEDVLHAHGVKTYSKMREEFLMPPGSVSREIQGLHEVTSNKPKAEDVYYGATVKDAKEDLRRRIKEKAIAEYASNVDYVSFMFNVEPGEVELISSALLARGVGAHHGFGWFNVLDAQVAHNSFKKAEPKKEETLSESPKGMNAGLRKIRQTIKSRLAIESVVKDVRSGGEMTFDYLVFTVIAAVIACVGLATDNAVVIVASMLVSPLMGPILAFTFGTFLRDYSLVKIGLASEMYGIFICLLVGFIGGLAATPSMLATNGLVWPTGEMCSRITVYGFFTGFFIALPSGIGVALSVLGGNAGGLVGVAISASLLPPAVNSGLVLAYGTLMIPLNITSFRDCETGEVRQVKLPDNLTWIVFEAALWSIALTIMNIGVIWATSLLMFRIKSVVPSLERDKEFWGTDLKYARKYNKLIDAEDELEALEDIDPENGLLGKMFFNEDEDMEYEDGDDAPNSIQSKTPDDKRDRKAELERRKQLLRSEVHRLIQKSKRSLLAHDDKKDL